MALGRRTLIRNVSIAIFGLSGCLEPNSGGLTDISVSNETSNEVVVTIQVIRRSDDKQLLVETVPLDAGAAQEYDEVVSGAEVQVKVQVEDGAKNEFEWSDGESDASGLHIDINSDSITFSPVVR